MIAGLVIVLVLSLWGGLRGGRVPSLVVALAGALGLMAVTVLALGPDLASVATGPSLPVWTPDSMSRGAVIFLAAAISLTAGAALAGGPTRALTRDDLQPYIDKLRRAMTPSLVVSYIAVAAWIVGRGPVSLIHRDAYMPEPANAQLVTVFGPCLALAFGVGAFAWYGDRRLEGGLLMTLVSLSAYAGATRLLALLPVLWLIARQMSRPTRPFPVLWAVVLSWLALDLVLRLRDLPDGLHGAIPYARYVVDWHTYIGQMAQTLGNILFAVPLSGRVSTTGVFDLHALAVSVNPLPGASTDWAELSPQLRLHLFIPFNAFGELATLSLAAVVVAFVLLGAILGRGLVLAHQQGPLWATLISAAGAFSMVLLMQYNLRSGMRVIYLLLLAVVVLAVLVRRQGAESGRPPVADALP